MNRKGFTLAEVMGIIILLGVLALVTVPAVEHYVDNSREKSYNSTVNQLVIAAKNWNLKYGSTVTWNAMATSDTYFYTLNLSDLKQTEFLIDAPIIDPRTKTNMDGCIYITSINDTYKYTYYEGCDY